MLGMPDGFVHPIGWIVVFAASIEARIDGMIHGLRGLSIEDTALPENRLKVPFKRKTGDAEKLARSAMPPEIFEPLPSVLKRAELIQKQRDDLVHGSWYLHNPSHGYAKKMRPGTGDGRFRPVKFDIDGLWQAAWEAKEVDWDLVRVGQNYGAYLFDNHPDNAGLERPEGERG